MQGSDGSFCCVSIIKSCCVSCAGLGG
ncbi:hypothetical protein HPF70_0754, partial [Helicobacter pylori]